MSKKKWASLLLSISILFVAIFVEQVAFADPLASYLTCLNNFTSGQNECQTGCQNAYPNNTQEQQNCMNTCMVQPEGTFNSCTEAVQRPQQDFCTTAREVYQECVNHFNSCSGIDLESCDEALSTCETNSGIDQCQ